MLLETAKAVLDSSLDEGLLKELPLVGIAARLYGVGRNLRERIFLIKLIKFLEQIEQVGSEERDHFVRELEQDKQEAQRTGASLLQLIERMGEGGEGSSARQILCRLFARQN